MALQIPDGAEWDEETQQLMKSYWKTEFCPVATQLLDRIERHHTYLVPLDTPSDVTMIST